MNISVIIPTFNRSELLVKAIESVLVQSDYCHEIIVIDDGSTDNTSEVLDDYIKNGLIRYLSQDNQGVSSARNRGVKEASGDWIAFLDSDDLWHPNKLKLQTQYIQSTDDIKFVHGEEIWMRNGRRVNLKKKHSKNEGNIFQRSMKLCLISTSTVLMSKSLFVEMEGFREDFKVCEDFDLWLKILSKYDVGFIDEPVTTKNGGHDDQLSTMFFAMDYWRVKSLAWLLQNRDLDHIDKSCLIKVTLSKAKQLLNGYVKHDNLCDYDEVKLLEEYVVKLSKDI